MAVAEHGDTEIPMISRFLKQEAVLVVSWILAIISMFFIPPSFEYVHYLDIKVLGCLLALMIVVAVFRKIALFDRLAYTLLRKVRTNRQVSATLIGVTFFSSMLITNDVALITFVPFTMVVFSMVEDEKPILPTVILQTIAANVGSSLTPMGNPQNLYMYSFYGMSQQTFFSTMLPMVGAGAVLLGVCLLAVPKGTGRFSLSLQEPQNSDVKTIVYYCVLFVLAIAGVFNIVPWYVAVGLVVVGSRKDVLKEIDYSLLLTFVGFFIFIGNLGAIESVKLFLERILATRVFLVSLGASQLISNVPATLLLSHFTDESVQLLLGVNAGGCGTLIASLASVISFKIFTKKYSDASGKYLLVFTVLNGLFVALFIIVWAIFFI